MSNSLQDMHVVNTWLDEVFLPASLTANLEANSNLVLSTSDPKTVKIAQMLMQGLGDYSRDKGFPEGSITTKFVDYLLEFDRGRQFGIDRIDNMDTLNIVMQNMAAMFMKEYVVPEVDAIRFARMAENSGNSVASDITTAEEALEAWETALATMIDAEVPEGSRVAYFSTGFYQLLKSEKRGRERLVPGQASNGTFTTIDDIPLTLVPKSRFYTAVSLLSGREGEEAGGVKKGDTGKDIHFQLVYTPCVQAITRHAKPRFFHADINQTKDSHSFDYRLHHDLIVLENKKNGIYTHSKV